MGRFYRVDFEAVRISSKQDILVISHPDNGDNFTIPMAENNMIRLELAQGHTVLIKLNNLDDSEAELGISYIKE